MNFDFMFPNNFLKASDVATSPIHAVIDSVVMESLLDGECKPCIYLRGEKAFILNKTNGNVIAAAYGDDTDSWIGKPIALYEEIVPFKGKLLPAIRVRIPDADPAPNPAVTARPVGAARPVSVVRPPTKYAKAGDIVIDADIPF